jgi:hypothetical protein
MFLAGVFGSVFTGFRTGEQRRGGGHIDSVALPARNA